MLLYELRKQKHFALTGFSAATIKDNQLEKYICFFLNLVHHPFLNLFFMALFILIECLILNCRKLLLMKNHQSGFPLALVWTASGARCP